MRFAKTIVAVVAFASALPAFAQASSSSERFSPLVPGYMERARTMSDAGNYAGVIDQLRQLDTRMVALDRQLAEEYTYLLAEAYYERNDEECLALLMEFRDSYPASPFAARASLAIGDFYFFRHEWPDALEAYSVIDPDRLNRDDRLLYTYRKALSQIKTGHFKEARPLVRSLKGVAGYEDAYWFYNAYLDYIDGDFVRAYDGFSRVSDSGQGLESGYYMAQIEYSRGEYDNVIRRGGALLRRALVAELVPEMQRIVGLSYFKTGDYDEAYGHLNNYMAGVQGTPSADAVYALGAVEYADGKYSEAAQRFASLTDNMDAVGQGAWLYLGQCYLHQGNASSAAMAFEKATRMDIDRKVSESALYNYVTTLTRGGKVPFSSSSELLEKFVMLYPNSEYTPKVEAYLATAYYNDREYNKALECIDAIRNPTSDMLATRQKILYELGIESVTNGRADRAVNYLSQAVDLRRHDRNLAAQASLWLGDALFSLGRFGEAQKSYEAFIRDDTSHDNLALGYYDLAYAKYKQKNYRGAASDFASALRASSAKGLPTQLCDDARVRRADCLYYVGEYGEAAALYSQVIDNGATDTDYALYRRAILHGLSGDTKSKLNDLKRVDRDFPNSRWLSKVLLEEALTYEETGQTALAADAYKKRLGVTADVDIDELLRMAATMHESGRSADMLEVVDRIRHTGGLEADEMAEINLYEADALADLGRTRDAEAIYMQLAQNPTSLPGSKAAVALAENRVREGNFESARVSMEEFTETGTPHQYWLARGFIVLADAYHGLGEKTLAREYILSLKENYPGKEDDISSMISSRLKKWK